MIRYVASRSCPALTIAAVVLAIGGCSSVTSADTDSNADNGAAAPIADGAESSLDSDGNSQTSNPSKSLAVFEQRILPIFQSKKPSSCSECHLSGVDLKDYIRPTQAETFASLVAADLINTEQPDESKLLQFIRRAPETSDLMSGEVRKQEYEAFREWIRASVADPELATADAVPIGPQIPDEVIRHARQDRVLQSFIDNVWTEVGRCAACHSPDRNQKQVEENGEQVSWITLDDPQKTLSYMRENELIDVDDPAQSLLLLKPTMQVEHGGGQKMLVGDRTYKQFRRFIDDYASVVHGRYAKADELPSPSEEVSVVSEIWLKIEEVPAEYDQMLLQVDLHQQTEDGWSDSRVASSDRAVFGKGKLWQHSLSLIAERGSTRAAELEKKRLPPGRYLLKIYVDRSGKLKQDFKATVDEDDLVGEVEVESRWPAGYGKMTKVRFPK